MQTVKKFFWVGEKTSLYGRNRYIISTSTIKSLFFFLLLISYRSSNYPERNLRAYFSCVHAEEGKNTNEVVKENENQPQKYPQAQAQVSVVEVEKYVSPFSVFPSIRSAKYQIAIFHFRYHHVKFDSFEIGFRKALEEIENQTNGKYKFTWVNLADVQNYNPEKTNNNLTTALNNINSSETFEYVAGENVEYNYRLDPTEFCHYLVENFHHVFVKSNWDWIVDNVIRATNCKNRFENNKISHSLLISGSHAPPNIEAIQYYDLLFYETNWYAERYKLHVYHPRAFHAFGIDFDFIDNINIKAPKQKHEENFIQHGDEYINMSSHSIDLVDLDDSNIHLLPGEATNLFPREATNRQIESSISNGIESSFITPPTRNHIAWSKEYKNVSSSSPSSPCSSSSSPPSSSPSSSSASSSSSSSPPPSPPSSFLDINIHNYYNYEWDFVMFRSLSYYCEDKRTEMLAKLPGNKMIFGRTKEKLRSKQKEGDGQYGENGEKEEYVNEVEKALIEYLEAHNVTVLPMLPYNELMTRLKWLNVHSKIKHIYVPDSHWDGGERSVLEGRALGIDVVVEEDNQKLQELLTSPIYDYRYYARQLIKGLESIGL